MISILIYLLCVALVLSVVIYIIRLLPLPAPFDVVAQAIVALIFLLLLVEMLTGGRFTGLAPLRL